MSWRVASLMDFLVVTMDDFPVIISIDFLDKVQAFPISFVNSLCIMDNKRTYLMSIFEEARWVPTIVHRLKGPQ